MKRLQLIIIIILLSGLISYTNAQDRIQSISTGISLLGTSKPKIDKYLSNLGFSYNNSSGNEYSYLRRVPFGSNTFMVAYKNQIVDVVAWTEYSTNLQNVLSEIKSTGFEDGAGSNYYKMYSFKNYHRNILLTLIVRVDMNDFQVTIGKINSSKPIERTNNNKEAASEMPSSIKTKTTDDVQIIEREPFLVISQKAYFYNFNNNDITQRKAYLVKGEGITALNEKKGYVYCEFTNSKTNKTSKGWILKSCLATIKDNITSVTPLDVAISVSINTKVFSNIKLTNNDFDTYTGIIQSVDKVKDEDGNIDFVVYCKDQSCGYDYVYVTTTYFTPDGYSKETISAMDSAKFRQIIKPGRRIEFHVISQGTGVLKHLELIYIKALPKATITAKKMMEHYDNLVSV